MNKILISKAASATVIAGIIALLAGCATTPSKTLFDRLGGLPALAAVTDKTIDLSASDPRTKRSFENIKLQPLKESITNQLCQLTGGPCKYEGEPMQKAHKGLAITADEFDGLVGHLSATLDQFKVDAREKNELIQLLAPLKGDVVLK